MRADDDRPVAPARNACDNAVLAPGMFERLDCCPSIKSARGSNRSVHLAEEPFRALTTIVGLVVAGMEGCELLKVGAHVLLGQGGEVGPDGGVERRFGGEARLRRGGFDGEVRIRLCYIHEVDASPPKCPFLILRHGEYLSWRELDLVEFWRRRQRLLGRFGRWWEDGTGRGGKCEERERK